MYASQKSPIYRYISSEEPYISAKEPYISAIYRYISAKEPYISAKEPYISAIYRYISSEEPYISAGEPCTSTATPCAAAKEPNVWGSQRGAQIRGAATLLQKSSIKETILQKRFFIFKYVGLFCVAAKEPHLFVYSYSQCHKHDLQAVTDARVTGARVE